MLKKAWELRQKGVSTAALAEKFKIGTGALLGLWRRFLGVDPNALLKKERRERTTYRDQRVHHLRMDGMTYKDCCPHVGLERTIPNARKLEASHKRYCKRNNFPFTKGKHLTPKISDEKQAEMVILRGNGKTYAEACRILRIPETDQKGLSSSLKYYCEKRGITWPIPGSLLRNGYKIVEE